jgi:hypothetical protein
LAKVSYREVLWRGLFRRVSNPSATRGALVPFYLTSQGVPCPLKFLKIVLVIYDSSSIRETPNVSYVLKLKGKHFIDPKRSEILSVFQFFFLFWPKLPPALFFRKT